MIIKGEAAERKEEGADRQTAERKEEGADRQTAGRKERRTDRRAAKREKASTGRRAARRAEERAERRTAGRKGRWRRGSLTVEAAWSVPLFFLCVTSLICMMDIYGLYVKRMVRLQEAVEKTGAAAGLVGTYQGPSVIDLCEPVSYRPEWFPVPIPGRRIAVRGRVHAWTGRDPEENRELPSEEENRLVYVTEYGSVYHTRSECTYLELKIRKVPSALVPAMRNAGGGRYHACEKCVGKGGMHGLVYITGEGDCYHNSSRCSGLTRKVHLVPASEAEGMHICSRCAAEEGKE